MIRAPKRRGRRRATDDEGALVDLMPQHLRTFGTYADMDVRRSEIADWIDSQIPGAGAELVSAVMEATGLTFLAAMRDQLTTPAPQRESGYEPQRWDYSKFKL
ncbi:Uncharacterised protein [Mycolicibacterium vanbaalenii]|uniref:Uncharacterized protein n=1 Tax=Mycolicibacterium vanbaalenii TaxID=110539 RepID=A0A5S9R1X3_MYCVN|nr:hypothetical protein [Mycolicibacterium vanbaalenii]CAA0127409.1 Uncharacterised protein [Mycolicibacterium vanbaalenii]